MASRASGLVEPESGRLPPAVGRRPQRISKAPGGGAAGIVPTLNDHVALAGQPDDGTCDTAGWRGAKGVDDSVSEAELGKVTHEFPPVGFDRDFPLDVGGRERGAEVLSEWSIRGRNDEATSGKRGKGELGVSCQWGICRQ